jgi:hypothetical protein
VEGKHKMSKFAQELVKSTTQEGLIDKVEQALDKESFKDFQEALANRQITNVAIVRTLKSLGVSVSENTIRRWRVK